MKRWSDTLAEFRKVNEDPLSDNEMKQRAYEKARNKYRQENIARKYWEEKTP
jgi:hypothetical protein